MGVISKQATLILNFTIVFLTVIALGNVNAAWEPAVDTLSGTWGSSSDQFGFESGDTSDMFPDTFYILQDGSIVIEDLKNGRMKKYSNTGTLAKNIICVESSSGTWNEECRMTGDYIQTNPDGNIWTKKLVYPTWEYKLYSPTGELLRTEAEQPLELGRVERTRTGETTYRVTVTYPDKSWTFEGTDTPGIFERDINGNLYDNEGAYVARFDASGNEIARVTMPKSDIRVTPLTGGVDEVTVIVEYGRPIIAPNGDVYTWKRTPEAYSIIKWTWQEPEK